MKEVKQVIVVRKDLNMRKGKIAAQVAHASLGAVLKDLSLFQEAKRLTVDGSFKLDDPMAIWLTGPFAKICVYVENEGQLVNTYIAAVEAGLRTCLITDSGKTEFHGVPTKTCLAIGPNFNEDIDKITGTLKLL